jgi:hypothetical protein
MTWFRADGDSLLGVGITAAAARPLAQDFRRVGRLLGPDGYLPLDLPE